METTVPAVPIIPTYPDLEKCPTSSVVGRITPNTLLSGYFEGRIFCWMFLKAFADDVLQAKIIRGQFFDNGALSSCFECQWYNDSLNIFPFFFNQL